jgi:hypothetical protein
VVALDLVGIRGGWVQRREGSNSISFLLPKCVRFV